MRGRYILMLAALLSCVSCLKDDNSYKTPQAAITSFTIGYYNVKFHDMNIHGRDTLVNIREGGIMYPMSIDQVNNRIFNVDSMAYGSDLSGVTTTVYGNGTIGYRYMDDPMVKYLWRSQDSIDFTRKVQFVVQSTDGSFDRVYDVQVNIRKVFPDSLIWSAPDTVGFPVLSGLSSAVRNDSVFCFGTDTLGAPTVSFRSVTGGNWTGANAMAGITGTDWSHRVTVCNGKFYTDKNAAAADNNKTEAIIAYVGRVENYFSRFLAIAQDDVDARYHTWSDAPTAVGTFAANHPITLGKEFNTNAGGDSFYDQVANNSNTPSNTHTGAAPKGWRLPSVTDWRYIFQGMCEDAPDAPKATDPVGIRNTAYYGYAEDLAEAINLASIWNIERDFYWTSSEYVNEAASAWCYEFNDSGMSKMSKSTGGFVRAVFAY